MAYASDKKPLELTAVTSLDTDDTFVVGDTSDTVEVVKQITKANLLTDLSTSLVTSSNVDTAGAVMNSDTSTAAMSFVVDEDDMVSDSATKVPTQQSVKAYVDASTGGDVVGPASATDNAIARFDSTTGKLLQNSGVTVSDADDVSLHGVVFTPDASPTAHTEGLLQYDDGEKALVFDNDEADVRLTIGQEAWIRVRNSTGATITNGSVVYISGATGQLPNITLAQADARGTSQTIGLATHDIENNTDGYVTTFGIVRDIDTSSYLDGDILYLDASTPGALTTTKPTGGNYPVYVGVVAYSHVSAGKIFVHPDQPIDVTDIAGLTATVTELNYTDGVTSAIQTQLDGKQPLDADLTTIAAANNGSVLAATTASFLTADETKLDGIEALADVTDTANVTAAGALMDSELTDIVAVKALADAAASDVNTGTSTTMFVTPDALAGSNLGIRYIAVTLNGTTALTTSDKAYFRIPAAMTGMNLVSVAATVGTGAAGASSSGTPTFTVKNVTDSNQMLSTSLTVDANEYTSATAATPAVINGSFDDVVTDDLIEVACTTAGTGTTYATITCGFQTP